MSESIVVIRLTRNLRYKLTYVKIFEDYLEAERDDQVSDLLRSLLQAYQEAIGPLASYLRRLDVPVQDLELDDKLLAHAAGRRDTESQLRFIYDGLRRATSWYKTQIGDRQMTMDPELRQLMVNLGEIDAAKLWRTEAVMTALRIPLKMKEPEFIEPPPAPEPPPRSSEWRPRLVDDIRRPNWSGGGGANRPATDRSRASGERGQGGRDFTRGPSDRDRGQGGRDFTRGPTDRDRGRGVYDRDRGTYDRDRRGGSYDRGRPPRAPRSPEREEGDDKE